MSGASRQSSFNISQLIPLLLAALAALAFYIWQHRPLSGGAGQNSRVPFHGPTEIVSKPDEFRELCERSLGSLPTRGDSKHFGMIVQADETLNRIASLLKAHPEFADEGRRFYRRCAENGLVMTYVRALCFSDLKNLEPGVRRASNLETLPSS